MTDRATALERETMVIRGVRSELRLEGGVITIVKEATTQATPTTVEIPVKTVRSATVEAPKRGGRGWLHIASTNGSPAPVGELAASGDPFALPITTKNMGGCRKLAKMVDKHVRERGLPGDIGPNQGRYTSGVVVTPMAAAPTPPAARPKPTKPAAVKHAAVKKAAVKKAAVKKAAVKKAAVRKAAVTKVAAPGRGAAATELIGQLRELGELHAAGVLDDAEFAAAKARILS